MSETNTSSASSPPLEVDVAILDARWGHAVPDIETVIRRAALAALGANVPPVCAGEISLALVNDGEIRRLNRDYRQQDRPTNVLSFPGEAVATKQGASPAMLGDVVIAFETVSAEADAQGKSLTDHLCHLVVHGVLHLLGYDHVAPAAADEMEGLEREVLGRLGISDPYAIPSRPLQAEEAP
ncbi:MAG: rRNA maturation RNase YbeY [Rhodospirillaceae bacterium]|nr:MAG: rRNA maturation RNase YbeY [Rhodospirillaceae bacterium]